MIRIITLLILIIGLGAGLYLVQHPQVFKPKARDFTLDPGATAPIVGGNGDEYHLEKGFQIDVSTPEKIPPEKIFNVLKPKWVRFVYFSHKGIPSEIPASVKILLIFNNEANETIRETPITEFNSESGNVPLSSEKSFNEWKDYTDQKYIPALENFLRSNQRVDAIQIWSEEDACGGYTSLCIPADAFAYMLGKAAEKIKSYSSSIKVIPGGLVTWDAKNYARKIKEADPLIYTKIDAFSAHLYGAPPNGWCAGPYYDEAGNPATEVPKNHPAECEGHVLRNGEIREWIQVYKEITNLPIWNTEIGVNTYDEIWLAKYLNKLFEALTQEEVPVAIWYAWTDKMAGGNGEPNMGLVDQYNTIKGAGVEFQLFGN